MLTILNDLRKKKIIRSVDRSEKLKLWNSLPLAWSLVFGLAFCNGERCSHIVLIDTYSQCLNDNK